jgi:hypothetical protein
MRTLRDTWDLGRQMSHSDCALIDCAERDETYITLSCVLFSIVVDSESGGGYCLYRFIWLELDEEDPGFQHLT